ncbi:MAG: hypothetical protein NC405_03265 [Odoribacter sp.]|nr:hypothetical protein [Odoribacter sp.]
MIRLISAILLITASITATGQDLRRPSPSQNRRLTAAAPSTASTPCDSVILPAPDSVAVAGFEKSLKSTREMMFVTNNTVRRINSLGFEITYTDIDGHMLHKVIHELDTDIPPGETRRIDVRSFDSGGIYYYKLSPPGPRTLRATPFDVRVKVLYITYPQQN